MTSSELPPAESLTPAGLLSAPGPIEGSQLAPELGAESEPETSPEKPKRTGLFVFGAVAIAAIAIFGFALAPSKASLAVSVDSTNLIMNPAGQAAPVFAGNKVNESGKMSLADLKGKTVVVNFWASWCGTCQDEAAVLGAVEKQWRDKGVVFVGVDTRDTNAGAKGFEAKYGIGYESVADPNGEIGKHYYVTGLPETYFISKSGQVVTKFVSAIDANTLNQDIEAAVAAN